MATPRQYAKLPVTEEEDDSFFTDDETTFDVEDFGTDEEMCPACGEIHTKACWPSSGEYLRKVKLHKRHTGASFHQIPSQP